jgi:hypothetical protein
VVSVGLPSNVRLLAAERQRLLASGQVLKVRQQGRELVLHLPAFRHRRAIRVRLKALRVGRSAFSAPRAAPLSAGSIGPGSRRIPLVVE